MNRQGELMSDVFHLLAQPIVAMRATVELALTKPQNASESRQTLESCLQLVDQLMQEVALARELVSLEDEPPQANCDAGRVLREVVEEMEPVAAEAKIAIHLQQEMGMLWCSEAVLRRALFLMLDTTLVRMPAGGSLILRLQQDGDGCYRLEMRPGAAQGTRRELCRRLLRSSGGIAVEFGEGCSAATFHASAPARRDEVSSETQEEVAPKKPARVSRGSKLETGS